jgi:serine/threonine-protein kinase
MSVQASELASEIWTRWQGQVINGVFPLGRYLGCSNHSGVFVTRSAGHRPSEVAIKLVPTNRAQAELQLPRWKKASSLSHPHILRLMQWGGCQLDGQPHLYVVMEHADQTLAQLLQHRALTDDEAREMLLPILDALAFLLGQNLVQGQLKPSNILVVGDQLKLASDTIHRANEDAPSSSTPTIYDPPEAQYGGSSTAGDIWALGVNLFEALTRRTPAGLSERREAVELPADFSPAFREVVDRCLRPNPQDRPSVTELLAWARGQLEWSSSDAILQPAASMPPAALIPPTPRTPEPAPPRTALPQVASDAARRPPSMAESRQPRSLLMVLVAAVVVLALSWIGVRVYRTHRTLAPPSHARGAAAPAVAQVSAPVSAALATKPGQSQVATPLPALHEVIPDVPQSARRTIHGHFEVWVRVIVEQDGSVFAAIADRPGPSGYFQRLATEAAKKWTFPPVNTSSRRVMQIRFDFSPEGTTARAVPLD